MSGAGCGEGRVGMLDGCRQLSVVKEKMVNQVVH